MTGGSVLSKTADGMLATQKWLDDHPSVKTLLNNTSRIAGTGMWLKNFTPMGFIAGLVVNYGYDKLMETLDLDTAKEKLSNYLLSKYSDLNKEQANILAGTTIKVAKESRQGTNA